MKKIIVTILAIAYVGTSTGAMISMHYCMGKLANWRIGNDDSRTCGKCGVEKKNKSGCCKDDHKFLKSSSDQKITEAVYKYLQLTAVALPAAFVEITQIYIPGITKEGPTNYDPLAHHGVSIYILVCDYRI